MVCFMLILMTVCYFIFQVFVSEWWVIAPQNTKTKSFILHRSLYFGPETSLYQELKYSPRGDQNPVSLLVYFFIWFWSNWNSSFSHFKIITDFLPSIFLPSQSFLTVCIYNYIIAKFKNVLYFLLLFSCKLKGY